MLSKNILYFWLYKVNFCFYKVNEKYESYKFSKVKQTLYPKTQRLTMKQLQCALTKHDASHIFKLTHAFFFVSLLNREV